MTRRAPKRSAAGPPKNPPTPLREQVRATTAPAAPTLIPRRVSITGRNVANAIDVIVRSTTIEVEQRRAASRTGAARRTPPRRRAATRIVGTRRRKNAMTSEPGNREQRRPFDAEPLRERREHQRPEREAQRAAGDVDRHREAGPIAAEPVRERRRRRMERRAAETADDQDQRPASAAWSPAR